MTMYTDDPMLENMPAGASPELDTDTPDVEVVDPETPPEAPPEEPTPAETPPPEPETPPAQAAPDLSTQLVDLLKAQNEDRRYYREQEEARQRAETQRQQAQSAPKPLLEQPEWRERYSQAQQRAAYSEEDALNLARMQDELINERVNTQMAQFRQQFTTISSVGRVLDSATNAQVAASNGLITNEDFRSAVDETFRGDQAAIAQALSDPAIAEQMRYLAIGKKIAEGRATAPPRPTPPAPVQPAARQPAAPKPAAQGSWANDQAYRSGVIQDAFMNPTKYVRGKK